MWLHATSGEHHTTQSNTAHKEHGQTQSHHGNGASKAKLAASPQTACQCGNAASKAKLAHITSSDASMAMLLAKLS